LRSCKMRTAIKVVLKVNSLTSGVYESPEVFFFYRL
jgi:hypothetical protein